MISRGCRASIVNYLARLKMLYSEDSGMSTWFLRQIQYEYRKRWVNFRPQQPERYYLPEIDGDTRKHKVILKWLPPKVMKKIPLRKRLQDFMEGFRWWYYDGRTREADQTGKPSQKNTSRRMMQNEELGPRGTIWDTKIEGKGSMWDTLGVLLQQHID
ncbi:hypothetical protein E3N88_00843 [Mikania micrantha]|uniref:Uncharacterized protein n=1 Tax=Mikania micrantha TaxID=192012 RepID=A0A5N6Q0P6_9ASTR|nr:hypothetical protein E3N88_00843 [Mikania micrantha]